MKHERRNSSRAAGIILAAAVVVVVTASGYFAWRALDTAGQGASPVSAPADTTTTTTPPATLPPTTDQPTTTTTTTTTTEPPPTTTTVPPPPSYRQGSEGPEVLALQQRLAALGFWVPNPDGRFGAVTQQAVMAFQKTYGLGRDGIAGPATLAALESATAVGPREAGDHIEIDLDRQIMFVVKDGITRIFNTSTGMSGWRTPPGRFAIDRVIDGVRKAPLGDLYRPRYFNGGIALHGSSSIPGYPASHGCTRLHNAVVDFIWANDLAPIGTLVWVY